MRENVRDVKKKLRYIAVDFDSEMKSASESSDKDLHARVVLSGSTTMIAGIGERITKELTVLVPSTRATLSTTIEREIVRDVKKKLLSTSRWISTL